MHLDTITGSVEDDAIIHSCAVAIGRFDHLVVKIGNPTRPLHRTVPVIDHGKNLSLAVQNSDLWHHFDGRVDNGNIVLRRSTLLAAGSHQDRKKTPFFHNCWIFNTKFHN